MGRSSRPRLQEVSFAGSASLALRALVRETGAAGNGAKPQAGQATMESISQWRPLPCESC